MKKFSNLKTLFQVILNFSSKAGWMKIAREISFLKEISLKLKNGWKPTTVSDPEKTISEKLWCNLCDAQEVDPKDPTSGTFYVCWGHYWMPSNKNKSKLKDEYDPLVFSLCPECDPYKSL